jgi:hypothetical protein
VILASFHLKLHESDVRRKPLGVVVLFCSFATGLWAAENPAQSKQTGNVQVLYAIHSSVTNTQAVKSTRSNVRRLLGRLRLRTRITVDTPAPKVSTEPRSLVLRADVSGFG